MTTSRAERLRVRRDYVNEAYPDVVEAIEAEARATVPPALDARLLVAVLAFYIDQMPAFATAVLNREEYAAVMVDVKRVRAEYARLAREGSE